MDSMSMLGQDLELPPPPAWEHIELPNGSEEPNIDEDGIEKLYEKTRGHSGNIVWQSHYPSDLLRSKQKGIAAITLRYQRAKSDYSRGPLELHSITLRDHSLREAVQEVLKGLPGVSTAACDLTIDRPFAPLYFRWKELEERTSNETNPELERHLDSLIKNLKSELSSVLAAAPALVERGEITYDYLWTIFPLGGVTISDSDGYDHLYLISNARFSKDSERNNIFAIELVYLDYDGKTYGWRTHNVNVREFAGIKRIAELETIPIEHAKIESSEIQRLTERGKKACVLAGGGYKSHRGKMTTLEVSRDTGIMQLIETFVEGRIIVDVAEYLNHQQYDRLKTVAIPPGLATLAGFKRSEPTNADANVYDPVQPGFNFMPAPFPPDPYSQPAVLKTSAKLGPDETRNAADLLGAHQWTLSTTGIAPEAFFTSAVRGYCLSSKSWATFRVDNISPIKWNDNAFDRLVMSEARKNLIKAAVAEQSRNKVDHDDIVEGKGQGLVMLFSGPPGTGKTLTAESIADLLRLPLYSADATQLGDTTEEIERKLRSVLRLVASWEAVLLLDEADVFMGKRINDLQATQSNQRVAAFLRVLEYYKGILILTTNRPLDFDEAFYSRIHLTLRFPSLDIDSKKAIWRNFFTSNSTSIRDEELLELGKMDLNGRQIKNVIKLGRLLAYNGGEKLEMRHIRAVLGIMNDEDILGVEGLRG